MEGELVNHDDDYAAPNASHVFETAGALILLYHAVLRPLGLISYNKKKAHLYESAGLVCRFSYFQTWRQYEHAHTLFWLGKDWSWNQLNPYTWFFFLVPTVLIAADFIYVTWKSKKMAIDCMHYIAQLMWVFGNLIWAVCELFELGSIDDAHVDFIFDIDTASVYQGRWYASWMLLCAYIPIIGLYMVWLPLTCSGRLKAADIPENEEIMKALHSKDDTAGWNTWARDSMLSRISNSFGRQTLSNRISSSVVKDSQLSGRSTLQKAQSRIDERDIAMTDSRQSESNLEGTEKVNNL